MADSAPHHFNRFELKYVADLSQAAALRDELRLRLDVDTQGAPGGTYPLWSLYFDSPTLTAYWEKIDGHRFRRKVRIRHYGDPSTLRGDTSVMVEIKQRVNRVTQKRRAPMSYDDALALCCDGVVPEHEARDDQFISEVAGLVHRGHLRPTTVVGYHREALVGGELDDGLRVTFDRRLRGRARDLDLRIEGENRSLLPVRFVVIEVKIDERAPRWLTYTMARHGLRLVRVSKYCLSVEACGLEARSVFHPNESNSLLKERT
jgi:hypothetical protein